MHINYIYITRACMHCGHIYTQCFDTGSQTTSFTASCNVPPGTCVLSAYEVKKHVCKSRILCLITLVLTLCVLNVDRPVLLPIIHTTFVSVHLIELRLRIQWRRQLWGTCPPSTSKSESQLSKY